MSFCKYFDVDSDLLTSTIYVGRENAFMVYLSNGRNFQFHLDVLKKNLLLTYNGWRIVDTLLST